MKTNVFNRTGISLMNSFRNKPLRKTLAGWCAFATVATTCSPAAFAATDVLAKDGSQGGASYNYAAGGSFSPYNGTTATFTGGGGVGVIDWANFNVMNGQTLTFDGNSAVYNVANGMGKASQILGTIDGTTPNVFVFNPNGVLIGNGASINVGGVFGAYAMRVDPTALTSWLAAPDTLPGADKFSLGAGKISVEQGATITAAAIQLAAKGIVLGDDFTGGTTAPKFNGATTLTAGSALAIDSVAGGTVKVGSSLSGDIDLMGTFTAGLTAKAGGEVKIIENEVNVQNGNFTVEATGENGGFSVQEGTVTVAKGDLKVDVGANIGIQGGSQVSASGDVSLTAAGLTKEGRISVKDENTQLFSGTDMTLKAKDGITVSDGAFVAADDASYSLTFDGVTSIYGENTKVAGGTLVLKNATTEDADATILAGTIKLNASGEDIKLNGAANEIDKIEGTAKDLVLVDTVDLTQDNALTLDTLNLKSVKNVTLENDGNVMSAFAAKGGDVSIKNGAELLNVGETDVKSLAIDAGDGVVISGTQTVRGENGVTIKAAKDIAINGDATVKADGTGADISLTTEKDLKIDTATVSADDEMELTAAGTAGIDIKNATVSATKKLTLNSKTTEDATSKIVAEKVDLNTAGKDVALSGTANEIKSIKGSAGKLTLVTVEDLTQHDVLSVKDLTLTGAKKIELLNVDNDFDTFAANAGGNIRVIDLDDLTVKAVKSTNGGIAITAGALTVTDQVKAEGGNLLLNAKSGDLTLNAAISAKDNISVLSGNGGAIQQNADVTAANGTVDFEAAGELNVAATATTTAYGEKEKSNILYVGNGGKVLGNLKTAGKVLVWDLSVGGLLEGDTITLDVVSLGTESKHVQLNASTISIKAKNGIYIDNNKDAKIVATTASSAGDFEVRRVKDDLSDEQHKFSSTGGTTKDLAGLETDHGDIVLNNAKSLTVDKGVKVTAGEDGTVTLTTANGQLKVDQGAIVSAGREVTLDATGVLTLDNSTVSATHEEGDIALKGRAVVVKNEATVTAPQNLTVTATGRDAQNRAVLVNNATLTATTGKLTMKATNAEESGIVLKNGTLTAAESSSISTKNGKVEIDNTKLVIGQVDDSTTPPTVGPAKALKIEAKGENGFVEIKNASKVAASGNLTVTAEGADAGNVGILVSKSDVASGKILAMTAANGDFKVEDNSRLVANENVKLVAEANAYDQNGSFDLKASQVLAYGDIEIYADGSVYATESAIKVGDNTTHPTSTIRIYSGKKETFHDRNLVLDNTVLTATENIVLTAGIEPVKYADVVLKNGTKLAAKNDLTIWAEHDVLGDKTTEIDVTDSLFVTAYGDVIDMATKFTVGTTDADVATFTAADANGSITLNNKESEFKATTAFTAVKKVDAKVGSIVLGNSVSEYDPISVNAKNDIVLKDGTTIKAKKAELTLLSDEGDITGNATLYAEKNVAIEATAGKVETTGNLTTKQGLDVKAGKSIAMTGVLKAEEKASFVSTGDEDIDLTGVNVLKDEITLKGGKITLNNNYATKLAEVTAKGDLAVTSAGKIDQTEASVVTVKGKTDLNAGNFDIVLANGGNDFTKYVNAKGKNIELVDQKKLFVGEMIAADTVKLTALDGSIVRAESINGKIVAKKADLTAENGEIRLFQNKTDDSAMENDVNVLSAKAKSIRFNDVDGVQLDKIEQTDASQELTIAAGGDITQGSTAIKAAATASFTAKSNVGGQDVYHNIALANVGDGNQFAARVNAEGADVSIKNAGTLKVGAITAKANAGIPAAGDVKLTVVNNDADIVDDNAATSAIVADRDLTLNGKRKIDLQGKNKVAGELTATANDDITFRNDAALTLGDIASSGGNIKIYTTDTKDRTVGTYLEPSVNNITLADGKTVKANFGSVYLAAYNDFTLGGTVNAGDGAVTLKAGWDELTGTYRGMERVNVAGTKEARGDLTIQDTAIFNLNPEKKNEIVNFEADANADVTIEKPGDDKALYLNNGNVTVFSKVGNIKSHRIIETTTPIKVPATANDTSIKMTAEKGWVLVDNDLTATMDAIAITAGGKHDDTDLTMDGKSIMIWQKAADDATLVTAKKGISLTATGDGDVVVGAADVTDTTQLKAGEDITVSVAQKDAIVRDAASLVADKDVSIKAKQAISVNDTAFIEAGKNVALVAQDKPGKITIDTTESVKALDGNIKIENQKGKIWIKNATVDASKNIDIDATRDVLIARGTQDATVKAGADITIDIDPTTDGGSVEHSIGIGESEVIADKSTVTAGGSISLTTKGAADGNIVARDAVKLTAGTFVKADAAKTIRVRDDAQVLAGEKGTATEAVNLTAAQNVEIDGKVIAAKDDVKVVATAGDVKVTDKASVLPVVAEDSVNGLVQAKKGAMTIEAGNDILVKDNAKVIAGNKLVTTEWSQGGTTTFKAGNDITIQDKAEVSGTKTGTFTAGQNFTVDNSAKVRITEGDIDVLAQLGDAKVLKSGLMAARDNVTITAAAGNILINGTDKVEDYAQVKAGFFKFTPGVIPEKEAKEDSVLTLTAAENVTIANNAAAGALGAANVTATDGDITVKNESYLASKGNMTLEAKDFGAAKGSILVDNKGYVGTLGTLTATAKKDITVNDNSSVKAAGATTLTATDGDIVVNDKSHLRTDSTLDATAGQDFKVTKDSDVMARGDTKVTTARDVLVENNSFVQIGAISWDPADLSKAKAVIDAEHPAANLTIDAEGNVKFDNRAAVGATGTATIDASGDNGITVQDNAVLAAEGEMKLTADKVDKGSLLVDNDALVVANNKMTVDVKKDVTVQTGSKMESKGDMKILADGNVLVKDSSRIGVGDGTAGTLTIGDAARKVVNVTVENNSVVESTGNATVDASGDVLVQNMSYWKTGLVDWDWTKPTEEPTVRNASDLTITADGNVKVYNNAAMGASGKATITAKGATGITVQKDAYLASNDAMTLDASNAGSILVDNNGNVMTKGTLTATAAKDITVSKNSNMKAAGATTLSAIAGSILVTDSSKLRTDSTLDAIAAQDFSVTKNSDVKTKGDATLTIGEDVLVDDNSFVEVGTIDWSYDPATGKITGQARGDAANLVIDAEGDVTIGTAAKGLAAVGATGTAKVNANGATGITVENKAVLASDKEMTLTAETGSITANNNALITANDKMTVDAQENVVAQIGSKIESKGDMKVYTKADTGLVLVQNSGRIGTSGTLTIGKDDRKVGAIAIDGNSTVESTGNATALVKGDVLVQNMSYWKTGLVDWDWADPTTEPTVRNASDLTITADGNVTVFNYAAMGASGKATITAKGADGIMVYQNAYLASKDAMDLDATAGDIAIADNANVMSKSTLDATAKKSVVVMDNSNVRSTGDMTMKALNGDVGVGSGATDTSVVATDGTLTLAADNGMVAFTGATETYGKNGIDIDAGTYVWADRNALIKSAAGKIEITAAGDNGSSPAIAIKITDNAVVEAATSVAMTSTAAGDITIDTTQSVTANNGAVTIDNDNGAVTIANGKVEANGTTGNIDIDATAGVAVNAAAIVDAEKDLDITTTGDNITTEIDTQLIAGGNLKVENTSTTVDTFNGNVFLSGVVTITGNSDIDATGSIFADNAQNDFVGTVSADAGLGTTDPEFIVLQDKNDLEIARAVTVNGSVTALAGFTDGKGSIKVSGDGIDANGVEGNVTLRAKDDIVANAKIEADTVVTAIADNDILINGAGQIEAKGGNAELTAGRDIMAETIDTAVLARDTVKLVAGRNIGNPIRVSSKDVVLETLGDASIEIDKSVNNPNGDLAVDDVNTKIDVGGSLDLTVAGNLSTPDGGVIDVGGNAFFEVGTSWPEINLAMGGTKLGAVANWQKAIAFHMVGGNLFPEVVGTKTDTAVFIDGRVAGGDAEYFSILQSYEAVAILGMTPAIRGAVMAEKDTPFCDVNVNVIDVLPDNWNEQFDDSQVVPPEKQAKAEEEESKEEAKEETPATVAMR